MRRITRKVVFETHLVSTVIKKKYTRNTLTSKVLDLKTLCNIQALNGSWRESIPDLDKNIYRVQGYIFDYAPKDINNALKKYCQACNMMFYTSLISVMTGMQTPRNVAIEI